jgi:hypothetical protein
LVTVFALHTNAVGFIFWFWKQINKSDIAILTVLAETMPIAYPFVPTQFMVILCLADINVLEMDISTIEWRKSLFPVIDQVFKEENRSEADHEKDDHANDEHQNPKTR